MNRILKFALASVLVCAGLAALAALPAKGDGWMRDLGLSKEQETRLEDLRYAHRKAMADLRHDLQLKMLDLKREMDRENPDPQSLDRLVDEAGALRAKIQKARLHHALDVKKILTPEQWEKARGALLDRVGRGGEGRERGRMGRGGRGGGQGGRRQGAGPGFPGCIGPGGGAGPGGPGPGTPGPDAEDSF